jgi:hypothetical protein
MCQGMHQHLQWLATINFNPVYLLLCYCATCEWLCFCYCMSPPNTVSTTQFKTLGFNLLLQLSSCYSHL